MNAEMNALNYFFSCIEDLSPREFHKWKGDEAAEELTALRARIAELEAALGPFAVLAGDYGDGIYADGSEYHYNDDADLDNEQARPTVGDLRSADQALHRHEKG